MITNKDVEKYKHLVYSIVNRYRSNTFKDKTYIDWDDIEQAGMEALCKASMMYDKNKGTFKNYVITAISRAVARQLKFYSKLPEWDELADYNSYSIPEYDNRLSCEIMGDRLIKIINTLSISPKSKQILLLRLQGYSLDEIGKRFNMSYQGVSSIIRKHKDKLRNRLMRNE